MYVTINSATYDSKENTVILEATDLDNLLLNDWAMEFPSDAEVTFKWDLTQKGHRIYLYKLMKAVVTEDCNCLVDMVNALNNKITNISANFLSKTEG